MNLNALEMLEIEEFEQQEEEIKQSFKIQDLETANWAFRKIKVYQKEMESIDELADKEIERIKEWQRKEKNKHEGTISFFNGLLTQYFLEQRESDPKFKISTPHGSMGTRKQQPKWNITNPDILLAWLKGNQREDLIKIKEEPKLKEIKEKFIQYQNEALDENGEVVPGIVVIEQEDKINIKIK